MDYQKQSNGWQTFLAHWWLPLLAAVAWLATQVLDFFTQLNGTRWIDFFVAAFGLMLLGGGLIVRARYPVYRRGQLFTFGLPSVPSPLAGCYHWGWRLFLSGVALSLGLLLSKP